MMQDNELDTLLLELKEKRYQAQPVKRVEIDKDDGGKRLLGIPTVRDRIVQQCLTNIMTPIFDPHFHPSSYGYRVGRSCHQAISKATLFIRKYGKRHVVDMDLSKCFDMLDHDLIIKCVRKRIADGSILKLIDMFLKSGVMVGSNWQESALNGGVNLATVLQRLNPVLRGFTNYFKIANISTILKRLATWIRRRLRSVQLNLWKKATKLHRRLKQLKYEPPFKFIDMSSWRNSASPLASYAMPNCWFDEIGLYPVGEVKTGVLASNY
jgi:retron-type reverse transcriptase